MALGGGGISQERERATRERERPEGVGRVEWQGEPEGSASSSPLSPRRRGQRGSPAGRARACAWSVEQGRKATGEKWAGWAEVG